MAAGRVAYSGPEWSELDDISIELKASLNIPNLRPFLRAKHLLTEAELEQVEYSPANPRDQAIDKLVSILKTKGPHHAEVFLEVLKLSLQQDDSHLGHVHLRERLEEAIRERKEMDALVQAVGHIPVPGNPIPVPGISTHNVMLNDRTMKRLRKVKQLNTIHKRRYPEKN